jgi:predicted lipoprotein with Yx(FWY)xxD motif
MVRAPRFLALAFVAALALAACGGDDSGTTTAVADAGAGAVTATTATANANATVTVKATSLGDVLADGAGRTLYVFTKDTDDTSNCTGACLQVWPRYAPGAVSAAGGIDAARFSSISVDGVQQLTVAKRPLDYSAGDAAPADVNGQGVGGIWWVVSADGTPMEG